MADLHLQLEKLTNQARFVQMIIDRKLVVSKKKKSVLVAELKELNFQPFSKDAAKKANEMEPYIEDEDEEDNEAIETAANSYDYLLGVCR